jgi:DNA-binding beta-propeller fold protein YncE
MRNELLLPIAFLIIFACSDDDGNPGNPLVEINSVESIKPDSTLTMEVMVSAPGLLAMDGINGAITSGDGSLVRTGLRGEGTLNGSATFDFVAGSNENTASVIRFTATDEMGASGLGEIEISITSLEIKQVLVLNEGNFFSGNGSIDMFEIKEGSSETGVYQANATVQQAVVYDDMTYLVTNAPDRVDILNENQQLIASVDEGLDNPIDFAALGTLGYVSNWGDINTAFTDSPDAYIAIIDLESNTIIDSVELSSRPQGVLAHESRIFIANEGGTTVSVLDPADLTLTEIPVPAGPSDFVIDSFGFVWVLCTTGSLIEIDPVNLSTGTQIDDLTTGGFNEKMAINGSGDFIYFLGGSNDTFTGLTTVYQVDLNTQEVTPMIENGFALYGIGVNSESGEIYLGDSNAFQSTGTAFRYDDKGNKIGEFATGIGPRGFLFK